jgi:hypothetical protein
MHIKFDELEELEKQRIYEDNKMLGKQAISEKAYEEQCKHLRRKEIVLVKVI